MIYWSDIMYSNCRCDDWMRAFCNR